MNILILGASSSIGQAIIKQLSLYNNLFLLTSNKEKIKKNINNSLLNKNKIKIIEADLSNKINPEIVINYNINIFINAACATSSLKNYEINPSLLKSHISVDLENPLILVDLDSDGILDAIVNNGALVCSESSWFYYGAAGPHVSIYYSGSDKVDHMMRGSWSIAGDENGIMTFN